MINMTKLLSYVNLEAEGVTTDVAREYAKLQYLEHVLGLQEQIMIRSKRLRERMSDEEVRAVEERVREALRGIEMEFQVISTKRPVTPVPLDVPEYLTVREVAKLKGITVQMVRRHLNDKKFIGHQVAGENSTWRIPTEQFINDHNWSEFLRQRQETFLRSRRAAETMIDFWEEKDPKAPEEE